MQNFILLDAAAANGSGLMQIGMIVLLVFIFYFFMIRPQQKRQKEIRKFQDSLEDGQRVVLAGGIFGKVRKVKENTILVEIAQGVNVTVDKNSVYPSAQEALVDAEATDKK